MGDPSVSASILTEVMNSNFLKFDPYPLDFANPNSGNMDVLQDFDFDSFLHQDADASDTFNFDAFGGLDGNEIGAE